MQGMDTREAQQARTLCPLFLCCVPPLHCSLWEVFYQTGVCCTVKADNRQNYCLLYLWELVQLRGFISEARFRLQVAATLLKLFRRDVSASLQMIRAIHRAPPSWSLHWVSLTIIFIPTFITDFYTILTFVWPTFPMPTKFLLAWTIHIKYK